MTALYGELILERFRHPRYFGDLAAADLTHEDVNPLCGDRLRVEVRLGTGAGERIDAVRFHGDACAIAVASADLLAEMVEGRTPMAAAAIDREALLVALGSPIRSSRLGCVSLPLTTLRGALAKSDVSASAEGAGGLRLRPPSPPRVGRDGGAGGPK